MRLSPLSPDSMSAEQKDLYDSIDHTVATSLAGFIAKREDGALLGPFNPMLHSPRLGAAAWALTTALSQKSVLPKACKEIAILVTGMRYQAAYEIYAHVAVGRLVGLSELKITALCCGMLPPHMSEQETVAYQVARALASSGPLPRPIFDASIRVFGKEGTAELVFLIGNYSLVSVLLNAYDIPVPDGTAGG
ncbi:carboxymuconolactone decarboxylase family protein [Paraburkholderia caledonica]|uniref:Alkylhydroperoxidase family enzyme n=1 Tax=Paraburkholderia caledonica TaxID=134536 RepID=A0ABU1KYV9_9BURK|nr:carboxymuconolactone decarboxylase family protein [Paraburkholderia caledonica]MDR6376158.1 alkylhydroperoxidase family enzyme [Paraburkholderia caledonica]